MRDMMALRPWAADALVRSTDKDEQPEDLSADSDLDRPSIPI